MSPVSICTVQVQRKGCEKDGPWLPKCVSARAYKGGVSNCIADLLSFGLPLSLTTLKQLLLAYV